MADDAEHTTTLADRAAASAWVAAEPGLAEAVDDLESPFGRTRFTLADEAVAAATPGVVAPDRLMFAAKTDYVGSLTAPFVNRNTAATFYGIGALVLAGLFAADRRRRRERGDDVRARPRPLDRLRAWTHRDR